MHQSLLKSILLLIALTSVATAQSEVDDTDAKQDKSPTTIAEHTKDMERTDGYFPFYWDQKTGSMFLEIQNLDQEFLYVHALATGLGSNPVGLDRGQLGDQKVVHFQRIGPKVMMVQRNLRFRARTENELERRAVAQSFAQSIVWGGEVVAESDGKILVDLTDLLLSDVHGVIQTLAQADQGTFSLDKKRSSIYLPRCKAFPKNTELESTLTFSGTRPGRHVRQTTPTPTSVTLRQHHSFIELPDNQYRPREYDVRSPSIFITFADYATPLDSPLEKRWITRHRLQKSDPDAPVSDAVEPIIYYVDAGAPELIQQALLEGASWWNQAFESAGFRNAFQVKLLPPDADPLDVRYNVIQWVHRSTRGWSYGGSVIDPRTGEIIKGHVTLGSLRVRQDQLLVNSLASPAAPGLKCACCGIAGVAEEASLVDLDAETDALQVALARIRQLSAHEVGHTLGFVHNFAASTYGDRASVMDYPAPRVKITPENQLDLSDAYAVGMGEWDHVSVQFAYSQFPEGTDEAAQLDAILQSAQDRGMLFISDSDSRSPNSAHPMSNLWDNGTDPLAQLEHVMKVRRIALDQFDPHSLPAGTTTADIAQFFTPLYLHHRYQLNATGKIIAGQHYEYGYAGQNATPNRLIAPKRQKQAIAAILNTIRPANLEIRKEVRDAISPRPYSAIRDQEILPTQTGRIFDPLAAARVAVDLALDEVLQPQRLARLSIHSRADSELAPETLLPQMVQNIWNEQGLDGKENSEELKQLHRMVREAILDRMVGLVDNPSTSGAVRTGALMSLSWMSKVPTNLASQHEVGFRWMIKRRADQVLNRTHQPASEMKRLETPPGSPIGSSR